MSPRLLSTAARNSSGAAEGLQERSVVCALGLWASWAEPEQLCPTEASSFLSQGASQIFSVCCDMKKFD